MKRALSFLKAKGRWMFISLVLWAAVSIALRHREADADDVVKIRISHWQDAIASIPVIVLFIFSMHLFVKKKMTEGSVKG